MLYWCEGEKHSPAMRFTNSDPQMLNFFLKLFRSAFKIDESKLRVCLHLHEYHDQRQQKIFWSKITGIPEVQFSKIYLKPNTGLSKKEGYPGCVSLRYFDHKIALELEALSRLLVNQNTGL